MPFERPPTPGTAPGTTTLEELKGYKPPEDSVRTWHPVKAGDMLSDVAKLAGYEKEQFWYYIDYVFPGCGKNAECVNWYLNYRYSCPPTRDGKNRAFKGGEELPLPNVEWMYGAPKTQPVRPGFYDRQAAVRYARHWAKPKLFNPAFPEVQNASDCTNFVSQCLLAGGWKMVRGGTPFEVSDLHVWWHAKLKPGDPPPADKYRYSWTWGGADNLATFLRVAGRGFQRKSFKELEAGDVIFHYDRTNTTNRHAMFVTARKPDDLEYAQHAEGAVRWLSDYYSSGRDKNHPDYEFHYVKINDSLATLL